MLSCYPKKLILHSISNNGLWYFHNKTFTDLQKNSSTKRTLIWSGSTMAALRGVRIHSYLPHLLAVIVVVALVSRILHRLLRFLKQPFIVCQLSTGILLFSFLPKTKDGLILNPTNRRVEYVIGWTGILFYFFIAGVKLDYSMHYTLGKKKEALIIGCSSLFIPMVTGFIFYSAAKEQVELFDVNADQKRYIALVLYVLCATFPVAVYEVLEEFCLLNSELGRLALSSSMTQACFGWACLAVFTAVGQGEHETMNGFKALICVLALFAFIILVIHPYTQWIIRTTPHSGGVRGVHILVITFVVFLMGLLSDISGSTTYVDAALATGMIIPNGPPLGTALIDRVDLVTSELLFPVMFLNEGYYFDIIAVKEKLNSTLWLGLLILVICISRIGANVAAAMYLQMPLKNGLLLGCIMNFRGCIDMIFIARLENYTQILGKTAVAALILTNILVLAISVPLVTYYYKPLIVREQSWVRAVERVQFHAELNAMVCFYDDKPVQALLEFHESLSFTLESNNSTCLYSLHLVEKQGRAACSLICHRDEKGCISTEQMNPVHNYFLNFKQATRTAPGSNVIPLTSVAPVNSMHHDICSLVLEKNISLVVVPYPKKNSIADLEANMATHSLVPLVLENAPCSVGIMVYNGTTRIMEHSQWQYRVCVLFLGGPDDRESIAIASRMAHHPGVYLNVIRFIASGTSGSTTHEKDFDVNDDDVDDKKVLDDKIIAGLQAANDENNRVIVIEVSVRDANQVILTIQGLGDDKYDLLIAGRRQENLSVLGDGLTKWTETPELGVLGDMLSTDISGMANVLIVQQHIVT